MRVLQIGADRSKRGILVKGSAAYIRQKAYADAFGALDIIGFTRRDDSFGDITDGALDIRVTRSITRFLYVIDAILMASQLPWPDVVSAQDPFETGIVALAISRFVGKPLHVQVHTDFLSPEYAQLSLMNRARVLMAGIVLRRAARVRVVSDRIRIAIQTRYELSQPVSVLPIYVDLSRIRSAEAPDALSDRFRAFKTKFLAVSRLEPEKHPCLAIDAFAASAPKDACLIFVGAGSERAYLEKRAAAHGVASRVFFEGEQDAVPYYALADLVLVTSRYEGYGLVIVEALARGIPVLSTDVGIAKEAGALIATEKQYAKSLAEWFESGPRTGRLQEYPYENFDAYVRAYAQDLEAAAVK